MVRARASVAKTRAVSRANAAQAASVRRGLLVGRGMTKAGRPRRHYGTGNPSWLDKTKGKTHIVDVGRSSGVMTFPRRQVKAASGGLKTRYAKISRAHSRKLDRMHGTKNVGLSRKVGTGVGGKRRTRLFSPGGAFNRLHPRGRGGRFIRK